MLRWMLVLLLVLVSGVVGSGCTRKSAEVSSAQDAVAAVFRSVGSRGDLVPFPRSVGTKEGTVNIGGPPPGQHVAVTYETTALPRSDGTFEVRFERRWTLGAETLSTTWTFLVTQEAQVQDLGQTGSDLLETAG